MATLEEAQAALTGLSPTQEKVDRAVAATIQVASPSRVFLFGSWASGNSTSDSDLDLAVFIADERKEEIGELREKIRAEFREIPMSIDLIVATEGHVAEFLASVNSVYSKIVHRGKLVYDQMNR